MELINGCNTRMHHIVASKGFQIVQYSKDLPSQYKIGKEIICFYNRRDLISKINYYINRPDERKKEHRHPEKEEKWEEKRPDGRKRRVKTG